jgi:hypothetical protein
MDAHGGPSETTVKTVPIKETQENTPRWWYHLPSRWSGIEEGVWG